MVPRTARHRARHRGRRGRRSDRRFPHLLAAARRGAPVALARRVSSSPRARGRDLVTPDRQGRAHVSASAPFDRHALRVVLRSRGTRLAMLGYFGHMWELYAMWTWIAAFAALIARRRRRAHRVRCRVRRDRERRRRLRPGRTLGRRVRQGASRRRGHARQRGVRARVSPLFYGAPLAVLLLLAVVWGFTIVADSAQFSALVADHTAAHARRHRADAADQRRVPAHDDQHPAGAADDRGGDGSGRSCSSRPVRCSARSPCAG